MVTAKMVGVAGRIVAVRPVVAVVVTIIIIIIVTGTVIVVIVGRMVVVVVVVTVVAAVPPAAAMLCPEPRAAPCCSGMAVVRVLASMAARVPWRRGWRSQ
jgi:hypothetical protein